MKEALEMVKKQLGPEAIILSAKDNRNRFGLVGEGSVEITAAVSAETLRKKQFTESRMTNNDRDRFQSSTARSQKQVMENFVNKYTESRQPQKVAVDARGRAVTRYADIDSPETRAYDHREELRAQLQTAAPAPQVDVARGRIRSAAARALGAFQDPKLAFAEPESAPAQAKQPSPQPPPPSPNNKAAAATTSEIQGLKSELEELKKMLTQIHKAPEAAARGALNSPYPGAELGIVYHGSQTFSKMTKEGVSPEVAASVLRLLQGQIPADRANNASVLEGLTVRYLLQSMRTADARGDKKLQLFVGPSGSGKTSSLIKIASRYIVQERRKIALVTTDSQRIGAAEQLRIYAQILNVPFAVVRSRADWAPLLAQLRDYDHVLCDFAGNDLRNEGDAQRLAELMPENRNEFQLHLVTRLTSRDEELNEVVQRYEALRPSDVIFNGLDEALKHGSMLNVLQKYDIPVRALGTGARVPEDFEDATPERVIDLIFHLSSQYQDQETSV